MSQAPPPDDEDTRALPSGAELAAATGRELAKAEALALAIERKHKAEASAIRILVKAAEAIVGGAFGAATGGLGDGAGAALARLAFDEALRQRQ